MPTNLSSRSTHLVIALAVGALWRSVCCAAPSPPGSAPPSLARLPLGPADVAVRIHYIGQRHAFDTWLTMTRIGTVSSADYRITHAAAAMTLPPPPPVTADLPWPAIWQQMTDAGFYSLPDENATQECETEPIPADAAQVVVDVRQGAHRHQFTYSAPLLRQCPAALRAASTLRALQDAFGHHLPFP
jgi:hypothetical protein